MTNMHSFPKEFQGGTSGQKLVKMKADHSGESILELPMCKTSYGFQQMLTKLSIWSIEYLVNIK